MVTEQELKEAYDEVWIATDNTLVTGRVLELAKEDLEKKILIATANGTIQGKNEGERKAAAFQLFAKEFSDVDADEASYKRESNNLALKRIHLDCLRDLIRIEELAKK